MDAVREGKRLLVGCHDKGWAEVGLPSKLRLGGGATRPPWSGGTESVEVAPIEGEEKAQVLRGGVRGYHREEAA